MSNAYSPLRWGILGAGGIAQKFCSDVAFLTDHQLAAVGSRERSKADAFAQKYDVARAHAGYEALVADPDVDVVYVATPHPMHREHCLLAIAAGKHVLCEKPFTINEGEAREVVAAARARGVFLMEGMWSRFFPVWAKVRALVADGAIGDVRMVLADFGFRGGTTGADGKLEGIDPNGRLYNPALGGGALLDVGVYPVSLAQMLLGTPSAIAAVATHGHTGVDENTAVSLCFPNGAVAALATSLQTNTPQVAQVLGTAGRIEVHSPWWCPRRMTLVRQGQTPEPLEFPFAGSGFQFEAAHVADCLRAGRAESDILPLDNSLSVLRTLDTVRAQIGLTYPTESRS